MCCHKSLLLKRQTTVNYTQLPVSSFKISITKNLFYLSPKLHSCQLWFSSDDIVASRPKARHTDAFKKQHWNLNEKALFCTEELSFNIVMFQWHFSPNDRIPCLEALTQTEWYPCYCILVMSGCVVSTITLGRNLVLICLPATLFP